MKNKMHRIMYSVEEDLMQYIAIHTNVGYPSN
jgi:hypothetical protein